MNFSSVALTKLRKGTVLYFIKKYSDDVTTYIKDSIKQFKTLFCKDYASQTDQMKGEKDENNVMLLKFGKAFTQSYFEELK
jgi:hypothetical protein